MKRIIVTGATSMIGISLIKEAIANKVQVLALDIKDSPRISKLPKSKFITFIACDLRELNRLDRSIFLECDCFYHFAWLGTSKEKRDNPEIQLLNIQLTLECVKFASEIKCKKFIGAGSQAEYGCVDGPICPETPCNPQISYGVAKLAAGKLGRKLADCLNLTFIWGRIFSVYGPNDNPETMISYAIEKFRKNDLAKFSSGMQKWNYLYEEDVGKIFFLIGCYSRKSKIYCIASSDTRPLKDFIEDVKLIVNKEANIEYCESNSYGIQPDISELIKDIGDYAYTPFAIGIEKILGS